MTRTGRRNLWRFGAYAALTMLPVLWLGVLLTRTTTDEAEAAAIAQAEVQARAMAASALEPFLTVSPLRNAPRGDNWQGMRDTTRGLLDTGAVLELRVRTIDGRVVFKASDPNYVDPPGTVDDDVRAAAVSARPLIEKTTLGADESDGALEGGAPAIEAYVGLRSLEDRSKVVAVAEIYLPYQPIEDARQATVHRVVWTIAIGLTVLWIVLAGIVASLAMRERRHRELAEQRSLHDRLTGLPGRVLYADRLAAALAAGGRTATDVALAIIDVDRFKEVNDTLGHQNGDAMLRIVADRLRASLRPGDTIARLGGDEFAVVLPGARADTIEQILRRLQDTLAQEAELAGVAVSVETSIGYAVWPNDADTAEVLQQRADLALHAAKGVRAAIVRYDEGIDEFDPQRLGLLAELRRAISNDELVLHYQPKVDAVTQKVVAFEALVRWQHPTRGLVYPDEFIPIAESTGLIGPLTHWVVDHALVQLANWSPMHPDLSMAVNISARNLRDDLPGWVLNRVSTHGVQARRLVLEITETSFAMDTVRATALLEELSAAGVRVSLDDFGQGYTSLGSLGHLPVAELKIDRGFVLAMSDSQEDRAIVASVIELGHRLGLAVVAEGVETAAVRDDLRGLGCDLMQGYLFSRPVPASAVLDLLAQMAEPRLHHQV